MRLGDGMMLMYKLRNEDGHHTVESGQLEQDGRGGVTVTKPDGSCEEFGLDRVSEWEIIWMPSPPR